MKYLIPAFLVVPAIAWAQPPSPPQVPPNELAMQNKIVQLVGENLNLQAQVIQLQRDLAAAKAADPPAKPEPKP